MERTGVPVDYWNAHLDDFSFTVPHQSGLFIYGDAGVGKTYLACACLIKRKVEQKTGRFISVPKLLMQLRDSYNNSDLSELEIFEWYSKVPVLVLDDLGVEKTTEWAWGTLDLIIDERCSNLRQTIITSNFNLNEIANKLGDRVASRICKMCEQIEISGRDRRMK